MKESLSDWLGDEEGQVISFIESVRGLGDEAAQKAKLDPCMVATHHVMNACFDHPHALMGRNTKECCASMRGPPADGVACSASWMSAYLREVSLV